MNWKSYLDFLMRKGLIKEDRVDDLQRRSSSAAYLMTKVCSIGINFTSIFRFSLLIMQYIVMFPEPPLEDVAEEEEQPEEVEDGDIGEEDEMADFIVDEEEVDENGAPVRYITPIKNP